MKKWLLKILVQAFNESNIITAELSYYISEEVYFKNKLRSITDDIEFRVEKINNLDNQIELINDNIKNLKKIFDTETFDIITCNPPYFKKKDDSIINENKVKSIARHEIEMELEDVMIIVFIAVEVIHKT